MRTSLVKVFVALVISMLCTNLALVAQNSPDQLRFVRQGVKRMIFDPDQSIPLATLDPDKIIGLSVMHPTSHYSGEPAEVSVRGDLLIINSEGEQIRPFGELAYRILVQVGKERHFLKDVFFIHDTFT